MSLDWQEQSAQEEKEQEIIDGIPDWDNLTGKQQDLILETGLEKWREQRDKLTDEQEDLIQEAGLEKWLEQREKL